VLPRAAAFPRTADEVVAVLRACREVDTPVTARAVARAWGQRGGRRCGREDATVAPENLAPYMRGFRKLPASHGLTGVLYGHFDAGCVHVRIDFDPATEAGRAGGQHFKGRLRPRSHYSLVRARP
jgi:FAD/FMN-containing dehydrogenase